MSKKKAAAAETMPSYAQAIRAIESVLSYWRRLKVVSNITTQFYAPSSEVSGKFVWMTPDGGREVIELEGYTPVGEHRSHAKLAREKIRSWSADEGTSKTTYLTLASFCIGKVLAGQLPSPTRPSWESTIRADVLDQVMPEDVEIDSVVLSDGDGVEIHYSPEAVNGVMALYLERVNQTKQDYQDVATSVDSEVEGFSLI